MSGRGRIFFSFPLLAACRLLGKVKVHKLENGIRVSEYPFYKEKMLRLLWPWASFIDALFYHIIFRSFASFCDVLILDRSAIDTFVDIVADTHNPFFVGLLERLFLAIVPKDSFIITLNVNINIAISRKPDVPSRRFLQIRKNIYQCLAKSQGWPIISTEGYFEEVHAALMEIIDTVISGSRHSNRQ